MKTPQEIYAEFESFLGPLSDRAFSRGAVLSFYTFSLDEFALFDLLRTFKVPQEQEILVFVDIARHVNRSVLAGHFKNLRIIRIDVTDYTPRSCAVFHPKLILISRGARLKRIAVTSANLRPYHYKVTSSTVETFRWWECDLPTKSLPILEKQLRNGRPQRLANVKCEPETIVLKFGNDQKLRSIETTTSSINFILRGHIRKGSNFGILAGAPFIAQRVVQALQTTGGTSEFWNSARGRSLHAKFLQIGNEQFWGSFNLTAQAFLGRNNAKWAANCETLLQQPESISFAQSRSYLLKCLGKPVDVSTIDDKEPGDSPLGDDAPEDWRKSKDLHRNAPLEVRLEFKNARLAIVADPNWETATSIKMTSPLATGERLLLKVPANTSAIFLTDDSREMLRKLLIGDRKSFSDLCSPKIEGLRGGKAIWESYLSIGTISDLTVSTRQQQQKKPPKYRRRTGSDDAGQAFLDMRVIRDRVIFDNVSAQSLELLHHLFGDAASFAWIEKLKGYIDD